MTAPDTALVAEVMLFAEGFSDARRLATKMTAAYRIASQQLSKQVCTSMQHAPDAVTAGGSPLPSSRAF